MKKYNSIYFLFILAFFVALSSCKEDDPAPNGPPPTSDNIVTAINAEVGETIAFTGTINDELGLTSITIVYDTWSLNETIDFPNNDKTYNLNYSFAIPGNATAGDHTVVITVLNTSGKTTVFNVVVTVLNPVPTITLANATITGTKADSVAVVATITHAVGITSVQLTQTDWGLNETIDLSGSTPASYNLNKKVLIPYMAGTSFDVTVTATSTEATQAEATQTVTTTEPTMFIVGTGYTDFPKVDWSVHTDSVLPMMESAAGVYTVYNLSVKEGAEMKFIGQTGEWTPKNYGWETKTADASVTMLNDESSGVFIFKKAGTYNISFNEGDLTCTITAISQSDADITTLYILGNGLKTFAGDNISESWWDNSSLAQELTETSTGSGVFEILILIDEASLITGNENYDDWGCFFYFSEDNSWGGPYGVIGGSSTVTDWYVTDPAVVGGNTFDFVPDLNEN